MDNSSRNRPSSNSSRLNDPSTYGSPRIGRPTGETDLNALLVRNRIESMSPMRPMQFEQEHLGHRENSERSSSRTEIGSSQRSLNSSQGTSNPDEGLSSSFSNRHGGLSSSFSSRFEVSDFEGGSIYRQLRQQGASRETAARRQRMYSMLRQAMGRVENDG
mmetsp:Transcript_8759/g.12822  ORF Transcript_8759/g.12822 Transcript_8759/m.12822 type:complete len:161 (-) Transcript_8759:230-712(-)